MKRILLLTVFAAFVCYVHAQVVYKRSDYLHANDEIPVVTYSNTDGITGMLMSDFITEEGETVFTNFSFEQYIEETLTFPDPYLYDEDEDFTNSTLVAFNDMGFAEFRKVNWDKVRIVGFKGELPMLGNMVSVFPEQALEIMYFPTNEGDEFSNTGLYSRKLAISEFQDMIPAEYYDVFAALYDSVKMVIEVELNSNYVENMQINIEHDFNYNSTRNVLKEIRSEYRSINVYIRSKFSGNYTPLNEAPMIGEQIPIELPMLDSSFSINYWAYSLGIPIVSVVTDSEYEIARSVQIFNEDFLNINPISDFSWSIYPNPTNGIVQFKSNKSQESNIKIFSIDGKLIFNDDFSSDIYIFDTQNIPQGLYLYKISSNADTRIEAGRLQVIRTIL